MTVKLPGILTSVLKFITYQHNSEGRGFVLEETRAEKEAWQNQQGQGGNVDGSAGDVAEKNAAGKERAGSKERAGNNEIKGQRQYLSQARGKESGDKLPGHKKIVLKTRTLKKLGHNYCGCGPGDSSVCSRLECNRAKIEALYDVPTNKDIVLREFTLGAAHTVKGLLVFMDGLVDRAVINGLLKTMMVFAGGFPPGVKPVEFIKDSLLPGHQVKAVNSFKDVLYGLNSGDSAFFFQGSAEALTAETKGWEHRSVSKPNTEQTVKGPQEAFVESLRVNTALIRTFVRSEKLNTEFFKVGQRVPNDVAIMYLRDLANPDLVEEVKRRIKSIKIDLMLDSGMLEGLIEDQPYNLNPQTLATERPDRVASFLAEGRVAILVNGGPQVLVVPVTMYSQLHTGEESYLRWQYGTFIRYVRALAFYLALLLPGSYLAVVLYHQEMIPTELLLAIAGNRERVPFPSVVEMLLMEFSFELVREAGVRIPGIIGTTIGIVGALILGQAAVQANIVSPILVILVAVTGLASFAIPSFSLSFAVRIHRYLYIFLGAILGFFGITLGIFVQIMLTVNLKSFGVPYLAPVGPRTVLGYDVVARLPLFLQERRPDFINPRDMRRQPKTTAGWARGEGGQRDDK